MRRAPPPSPSPSPSRWGFWETERLLGAPRAAHGSRPDRLDGGGFYPPFQPLRVEPRRYPEWRKSAAIGGGGGRGAPQNSHGSTYKGARSSQGRGGERGSGGRPDGDGGWRGSPDGGPPVGSGRQEVGELPARAGVALVAGSLGEPVGAGTTWRCGVTDCLSTEAGLRGRGTGGGTTGSRRPAKGEGERGRRCRGRWAAVRMRKLASALSGGGWREGGTCGEGCAPSTLAG
jgi:hypothetical protein